MGCCVLAALIFFIFLKKSHNQSNIHKHSMNQVCEIKSSFFFWQRQRNGWFTLIVSPQLSGTDCPADLNIKTFILEINVFWLLTWTHILPDMLWHFGSVFCKYSSYRVYIFVFANGNKIFTQFQRNNGTASENVLKATVMGKEGYY